MEWSGVEWCSVVLYRTVSDPIGSYRVVSDRRNNYIRCGRAVRVIPGRYRRKAITMMIYFVGPYDD